MTKSAGMWLGAYIAAGVSVVIIAMSLFVPRAQSATGEITSTNNIATVEDGPRTIMLATQEVVKSIKPSPPQAARLYAYTSTVYHYSYLATKNNNEALSASKQILEKLVPSAPSISAYTNFKLPTQELTPVSQAVLNTYLNRIQTDSYDETTKVDIPNGVGKWKLVPGVDKPLAPTTGSWLPWILTKKDNFTVQAPITPTDKDLYQAQVQAVKKAVSERNEAWMTKIKFWAGAPGTETPAGIWQNFLYNTVKDSEVSTGSYARAQMLLAQSLADSFIECWDVKYQYWTERPSMADPSISLAIPNPPFPAYVSGHSTASRTASIVLSKLFPDKSSVWTKAAEEARDTRLYAGIHFPQDNEEGFKLGEQIGKIVVAKI